MICQLIMGGHHYIPAHHPWAPEHYADTPAHRPAVPDMMAHQKIKKSQFSSGIQTTQTEF
jgi:hypothetical protein